MRRISRTGPEPDVYAELTLRIRPSVDGLIGLKDWINQTTMHIFGLLLEFKQPLPEGIRDLGIVLPRRPRAVPPTT